MLRVETVFTGRAPPLGFTSLKRQISSRLCILSMIWGEISVVWICISASVFFFYSLHSISQETIDCVDLKRNTCYRKCTPHEIWSHVVTC